jgi:hypothetical protein
MKGIEGNKPHTPKTIILSQAAFPFTTLPASSTLVTTHAFTGTYSPSFPPAPFLHLTLATAILSTILFPAAFPGLAAMVDRRSGGGTVDIGSGVKREVEGGCVNPAGECEDGFRAVVKAGDVGGPVGEFGF